MGLNQARERLGGLARQGRGPSQKGRSALVLGMLALAGLGVSATAAQDPVAPWTRAGYTDRQAAAHLLDRLTFGPQPGEVDRVVAEGLEPWIERQLDARADEKTLQRHLEAWPIAAQPLAMQVEDFSPPGRLFREAIRAGVIPENAEPSDRAVRQTLKKYAREKGYYEPGELLDALRAQKLIRSIHGSNQLQEVLTDFWFNHFNVSITDVRARPYVLSYERDVIRPNVLGAFESLLVGTARHPAMLWYLDNAMSTADAGAPTSLARPLFARTMGEGLVYPPPTPRAQPPGRPQKRLGINENFARELLELHTLGVDGGYTQKDVIEVARILTGWTVMPPSADQRAALERQMQRWVVRGRVTDEFIRDGEFLFRPDQHDSGEKRVLDQVFPAGGGHAEGLRLFHFLSLHPATAARVAHKLSVRFVADHPPKELEESLAAIYLSSGGNLRAVMKALIYSEAFWRPAFRLQKVKTPLELFVSAFRATQVEVTRYEPVWRALETLGQPLYACQPPTGYSELAETWVNAGALLGRMSYALQLAEGRVSGSRINIYRLLEGQEPESLEAALIRLSELVMPERPVGDLSVMASLARSPALAERIDRAAPKPNAGMGEGSSSEGMTGMSEMGGGMTMEAAASREPAPVMVDEAGPDGSQMGPALLRRALGVLLGSPAYQRR